MTPDYKKYYYYAHVDPNKEMLGTINTDSMGNAVLYFTAADQKVEKHLIENLSGTKITYYNIIKIIKK